MAESEPLHPAPAAYAAALRAIRSTLDDDHMRLLRAHYQAPGYTLTTRALALASPVPGGAGVPARYAALAQCIAVALDSPQRPASPLLVDQIPRGTADNPETLWVLQPELVAAIRELGWFD